MSLAPGFWIGNVIVMAGVPTIMQAMLDEVGPKLKTGKQMLSESVRADAREGDIGTELGEVAKAHPDVSIGSYPFFDDKSGPNTNVVVRSRDARKARRRQGRGRADARRGEGEAESRIEEDGRLRSFFFGTAILMACAAIAVAASYFYLQPVMLKVAMPAAYTADARILGAVADLLRTPARQRAAADRQWRQAGRRAQCAGEARPSTSRCCAPTSPAADGAQTVLIMRTEAGRVRRPEGRQGQGHRRCRPKGRIGVVRDIPTDGTLLPLIFDYYNIPRPTMNVTIMTVEGVAAAFRDRKIDTLVAVGPVSSKSMADIDRGGGEG